MRERLLRAALAVGLLLAFVGDLRVAAPVAAAVLVLAAWRGLVARPVAFGGAVVLAVATIAFETDDEVLAWSLVLAVAAVAGFGVAIGAGRPAAARRS